MVVYGGAIFAPQLLHARKFSLAPLIKPLATQVSYRPLQAPNGWGYSKQAYLHNIRYVN